MPSKLEKVAIDNPFIDRRVKLLPCQKERMRYMYETTGLSYNQLAQHYGVSKRLIIFCCNPDSLEKSKSDFSQRRKDGRYYDKEKHREAISELRKYKKELNQKGIL
jgi:hypothetical protein